nr:hypothetical protein [Tanacetum cinerariifolium]
LPRLTRSTTTLQPLPTIDPKEKVKEELAELDRARKERQKQEEATIAALTEEFDEIQARMDADHELVIDDFVPIDSEKEEKKSVEPKSKDKKGKRIKRVVDSAPKQKSSKKQKDDARARISKERDCGSKDFSTKYPIVDWESQISGNVHMEDKHVYKIIRANGNTSYHKSLSSILRKFNRKDLVDLHRLVMKIFEDNTPEGYNFLLWGDLNVMFKPNAEDEIWSNQQDWNLIS